MPWKVIDVSKYSNINDYTAVASSINGVLIKVGARSYGGSGSIALDTKFNTHYSGFLNKNIKLGFYFTSNAITEAEAIAEADYVYSFINNKENDFPVYFLSELSSNSRTGRADQLTPTQRTDMAFAFCGRIQQLGYRAGILAEDSFYSLNLDLTRLYNTGISLWVSRTSGSAPVYVSEYDAWRYTNTATMPGATGYLNESDVIHDIANWDSPIIEPDDINNFPISIEQDTYTYTGSRITPTVTVEGLSLGSDYTVSYEDNLNAGIASVIISGINNYTGVATKTFTILQKDISTYNLKINPSSYQYNGSSITPTYNIDDLMINVDFSEELLDNTDMGTATLNLHGINNYTGVKTGTFNITAKSISGMVGTLSQYDYTYSGEENKPSITVNGLIKDVDYIETYRDNINAGLGHAIAVGIGNYTGELDIIFNINPKSLDGYTLYLSSNRFTYSGEENKPKVSIYGLEEDVDFEVEYANNINVGTGRITVTGINNYKDELTSSFTIVAMNINNIDIDPVPDVFYTKHEVYPDIFIPGLTKDIDYRISYNNNIQIGTGIIVVGGVGNYSGTRNVEFNIIPRPMSETTLVYGSPSVNHNFRIYDGTYKVYCKDTNIRLEENIDYSIGNIEDRLIEVEPTEEMPAYTYIIRKITINGLGGFVNDYIFSVNVIDHEIFDEDEPDIPEPPLPPDPELEDDLKFNFGDIDEQDETAEGDYDFGGLEDGVDEDNVAKGDYDFNILTTADLVKSKLISNFGYKYSDIKDGTYNSMTGLEFDLDNTPIYANYCSISSADLKSGPYYIYRPEVRNSMIRITRLETAVQEPVRSTGWVKIYDLAMLDMYALGEKVIVTGKLFKFPNGTGSYVEYDNQTMYIANIQENESSKAYEYPYGLSLIPNGAIVGYGNNSCMEKADNNTTQIA